MYTKLYTFECYTLNELILCTRKSVVLKVLLVVNHSREDAVDAASNITSWLENQEVDVAWAPRDYEAQATYDVSDCDLVISLGGDGTLLRAARMVEYKEIPILGLSFGHLGFLTTAPSKNYLETIADAFAGELHCSKRATLDVELECEDEYGNISYKNFFAFNEVALTRGPLGDMVEFEVSVSGNKIDDIRGDGFVVSTSTGSTGYALSAGGPFVTPEFNGMVCVPIAPHTILARAFLTSPSDVVEIKTNPERPVMRSVFIDGRQVSDGLEVSRVKVHRGPGDILLYDRGATSFYDSVSRVFWGGEKKFHD